MTTVTSEGQRGSAPWHLWLVAIAGLLWNGIGGYDFSMTMVGGDAYLRSAGMTDIQISHLRAMPDWMFADWALGVWGSVLGSVLLLFRSRWAFPAFVASLVGLLVSLAYYRLSADGGLLAPSPMLSAVLVAACVFFGGYAWAMAKRGVLR